MFWFKFSVASVHLHFRPKNSSLHIWKLALVKLTSNLMNLYRCKHRNPREQTVNEMAPSKQKWFMPISQRSIRNRSPRLLWSPKIFTMQRKKCLQKFVAPFWSWSPPSMGHCCPSPDLTDVKCYISWVSRTVWEQGLLQSWTKVLGLTIAFLGRFPIHTGTTPPLTPQTMLDTCIQNFLRVSILYRVGGGRTARNFWKGCTVLRGNREMTEKHGYCSTVPRTFVQDCLKPGFGRKKVCSLHFPTLFRCFEDT